MHSAIISADMFFFRKFFAVANFAFRSPARSPFSIPSFNPAFLAS